MVKELVDEFIINRYFTSRLRDDLMKVPLELLMKLSDYLLNKELKWQYKRNR